MVIYVEIWKRALALKWLWNRGNGQHFSFSRMIKHRFWHLSGSLMPTRSSSKGAPESFFPCLFVRGPPRNEQTWFLAPLSEFSCLQLPRKPFWFPFWILFGSPRLFKNSWKCVAVINCKGLFFSRSLFQVLTVSVCNADFLQINFEHLCYQSL